MRERKSIGKETEREEEIIRKGVGEREKETRKITGKRQGPFCSSGIIIYIIIIFILLYKDDPLKSCSSLSLIFPHTSSSL